ncbi:MAG: helix-turn-helix transcriptional regulator [Clostridiaceae bacterium]|nr:helix-turn-helix transcriptional regulator [Clostridiaceae bacterium]
MGGLRSSEFFGDGLSRAEIPSGMNIKSYKLREGMSVSLVSFKSDSDLSITAYNDVPCIRFSYLFNGPVEVSFNSQSIGLSSDTILTSYAPDVRFLVKMPMTCRNIELVVARDVLCSLAGDDFGQIDNDICCGFCFKKKACDRRSCDAANRLARLIQSRKAPLMLIHAVTLEFLAWHLNSYRSDAIYETVSLRERKMLTLARDILLNDLSSPPTIAELSRATGLNQLKLKCGFKEVFGHSVYALFQRERMSRARKLLNNHTVTETAILLGYSNISHFSDIFKKQFGVLPREVRRGALD